MHQLQLVVNPQLGVAEELDLRRRLFADDRRVVPLDIGRALFVQAQHGAFGEAISRSQFEQIAADFAPAALGTDDREPNVRLQFDHRAPECARDHADEREAQRQRRRETRARGSPRSRGAGQDLRGRPIQHPARKVARRGLRRACLRTVRHMRSASGVRREC